jgi:hypothetical protein
MTDDYFSIGDTVEFDAVLVRRKRYVARHKRESTWERSETYKWTDVSDISHGKITGLCYKKEGSITLEPEEGWSFRSTGQIKCWEVKLGLKNKPVYVLPKDIRLVEDRRIPILWQSPWTEKQREWARQAVEDAPRDERGRFMEVQS